MEPPKQLVEALYSLYLRGREIIKLRNETKLFLLK